MTHIFLDKDEMNITKFKIEVDLICDKLGEIDLTADSINPLTFIWGNKVENPYTQAILNRSFKNKRRPADFANAYKNLSGFIKKERSENEVADRLYLKTMESNARYHFVFWALMILVVDGEENRNENASVIADAAYLLLFTKEMMEDWILAVKVALSGQKWQDIRFKTKEARSFFHRY